MTTLQQIVTDMTENQLRERVASLHGFSRDYWDDCFDVAKNGLSMEPVEAARVAYLKVMQWWAQPSQIREAVLEAGQNKTP